ncbi:MAG: hypothetical protein KF862_07455 [Chitinophagaceae bacterium]|nr:hypothetical protein [Chitinophagaceae bacterium]
MAGLQKLLKLYGRIECKGENGKRVMWVWDYANDKPRIESEMTKEEWAASEKAKYKLLKSQLNEERK